MRAFIEIGYDVVVIIDEQVHEITLILSILQDMIDGNISPEFTLELSKNSDYTLPSEKQFVLYLA